MNRLGVLLLAAVTATGGLVKPSAHKHWLRSHVVADGPAPGSPGCMFGHQGCAGGELPRKSRCGRTRRSARQVFPNTRSQIYFVDPTGMKIGWQTTGARTASGSTCPPSLTVPARYNFMQGYIYRLKLTDIPGRRPAGPLPDDRGRPLDPGHRRLPDPQPDPGPVHAEDFDQVDGGNFVTKVIYLPDPKYQELAIAGVETLVSTRLEPGVDPILEADRRGTILLIVRLGAIDLEMPQAARCCPRA